MYFYSLALEIAIFPPFP